MWRLRSLLFDLFFYIFTPSYLGFFLPLIFLKRRAFAEKIYRSWAKVINLALRFILGLSFRIEGEERLKEIKQDPRCLIASKHQSTFETIMFSFIFYSFYIILKKELTKIPIFGSYTKILESFIVDRKKGASALKDLLRWSKKIMQLSTPILIFPEGTRSAPLSVMPYLPGVFALYQHLNVRVYPVALNSGVFWGRRSFFKKPGVIVISILPPIQPGLSKKEFLNVLTQAIEEKSLSLAREAIEAFNLR